MSDLKPTKFSLLNNLLSSLHIDVARNELIITRQSGLLRRVDTVLHRHTLQPADWHDEATLTNLLRIALMGSKVQAANVSVTLDDSLVRMWMVTPPKNATSMADCQAAATLRFQALFGESTVDWEISADWDAYHAFLASAVPRSLLDRIHAVCAECRLTVQRIAPQFVMCWNQYRKQIQSDAWLATLNNDALTIGAIDQGRLVALRMVSVPYEIYHSKTWLDQHLQREALLFNLTMPNKLQVRGAMPPQWLKNDGGLVQCQTLGVVAPHGAESLLVEKTKSRAA